jgi:LmbE family N-acetylglucosaminyl deacetylase
MKNIVCIIAHPDDEAFGPGGTLIKLAKRHNVYIICATKGEAGQPEGKRGGTAFGKIRERELLNSAKILGVKKVFFLGFKDGKLSNSLYQPLAKKIERILKRLKPETIITYEPRGISGHIDHIMVSMVSSFVYQKLPFVKKIMYICVLEKFMKMNRDYFVYVPPGCTRAGVDLVVNVKDVWDQKMKAMLAHKSQIQHEIEMIKEMDKIFPKEEYFMVKRKAKN